MMPFIATCVDAIGTVFWDCPTPSQKNGRGPGKHYVEDWVNLLVGVYVVPTYSEIQDGSWSVAIVLHNLMGKLVHLQAGRVIARVLAAKMIPEGKPTPELIKKLDEQDPEYAPPKLSIEERQQLLMQLLR